MGRLSHQCILFERDRSAVHLLCGKHDALAIRHEAINKMRTRRDQAVLGAIVRVERDLPRNLLHAALILPLDAAHGPGIALLRAGVSSPEHLGVAHRPRAPLPRRVPASGLQLSLLPQRSDNAPSAPRPAARPPAKSWHWE